MSKNEIFVCLIDDPKRAFGESFRLRLDEVESVDKDDGRWYVRDSQGTRHWLMSHYGNPADKFICERKRLRPHIKEIGT